MSVKTNVEEMLVEKGIITRAQLERVKKVQFDHRDKSLTDIMLLLGSKIARFTIAVLFRKRMQR